MKRALLALCAAAITLSAPVAARADDSPFYYDEKGIIRVKPGTPNFTESPKIEYPANPFADDAPNPEQLLAPKQDDTFIPVDMVERPEPIETEEETEYEPEYVDYDYVIVAVNPKMKRYMARSMVNPKKNVIFLQADVITERQLKKGEKVVLTFDEDNSDGIDSERKDGLVYVTPIDLLNLPEAE
jgi:hypothetical protein